MKLFSAFTFLLLNIAIAAPAVHMSLKGNQRITDISTALSDGTKGNASGDNAISVAASKDSGAAGVKGEDVAIGAAGPSLAVGLGTNVPESPSGGLFGIF